MLRIKKLHWKLEKVEDCKLVHEHSEENGHDCWGNLDWISYNVVFIKGKMERVSEGNWILHDGRDVKEVLYDWQKELRFGK